MREQFSSHLNDGIVTLLPVTGRRRDWKLDPIGRMKIAQRGKEERGRKRRSRGRTTKENFEINVKERV